MAPDEFQKAWQAHLSQTRVTVDADLLRKEVQLEQHNFRATILGRDFTEIGLALVMIPCWVVMGIMWSLPWTWYLSIPVLIWMAGFMLVYRKRHAQPPSQPDDSLVDCVQRSLKEQEDQIWLLRNVLWWYLLPPGIAVCAFFAQVSWQLQDAGWLLALIFFVGLFMFVVVLYAFIYYLNQRAVRMQLEPKRDALQTLLTSLTDESANSDSEGVQTVTVSVASLAETQAPLPPVKFLKTRLAIGLIGFVAIMGAMIGGVLFFVDADSPGFRHGFNAERQARRSPFEAVRWQNSLPEVRLDNEWFKLVSLNDIPAEEIVSFSRRTYEDQYRKRFEEDLVEILKGMKNPPGDTVTLELQSLTSSKTEVRKDVPMTYENRQAIRDAAADQPRSQSRRERVSQPPVSIDDAKQFRERVDTFLQRARIETGFAGVVLVARAGEPVYEGTFGYSHLESKTPNSLDTPFRIAGLSQTFTAAAIFALEADGELSIDDPVFKYLPEFEAEPYRAITIYHLLTHSSGLPYLPGGAWFKMRTKPTPLEDYVRLAVKHPLSFDTGTRAYHSRIGYHVLSAIIEKVSGDDYAHFMQERLFTPLGLQQTGVAQISQPPSEAKVAETTSFSVVAQGEPTPYFVGTLRHYGIGYGSSGIYSSANDLLKWNRVLAGDDFFSAEQTTRLFRPFKRNYACGWIIETLKDDRFLQTNIGKFAGHTCRMMRVPEDDLVIIALGNVDTSDEIEAMLEQLFRLCRSLSYEE
ncbi:serine hydrolase domain-containing protein [Fuerstiella marisgermanici]|uniref:Penicillin-binding protein E n=1 Tax=Fuerstiella marisgermanici TaxID=1891926 RepID=A0A1P8WM82_9PLAN|nr:serine hydrolase domain-containing protein [Fuerstiella marisgermanici]APZ95172.1 Penicillin-binding protein E [Fuerstiella marisgermanici]